MKYLSTTQIRKNNFTAMSSTLLRYLCCLIFSLGLLTANSNLFAQCDNTFNYGQYGSLAAPGAGSSATVFCQYAGEYHPVTGVVAGTLYKETSTVATDFITVRLGSSSGFVVAAGVQPLSWQAPTSGTYYVHTNTNSACGIQNTCRDVTMSNPGSGCLNTSAYGSFTAPTTVGGTSTVSCQYAGEYSPISGAGQGNVYMNTSTISTDFITIRQGSSGGAIVASGVQPLYWQAPATDTYYAHTSLNSGCGTQNSCRNVTITLISLSCTNPTVSVSPTSTTMCAGESVTLTASGDATTYTWAPAAGLDVTTGATVIATPSGTTTYTVTGTVSGGCSSTATSVVTITPSPSVTATATPDAVCSGGTSQLNGVIVSSQLYHIGLSNLVGIPNDCGGGSRYNGCGADMPGFTWTDVGGASPTSIQIQVQIGVDCNGSGVAHTVFLNGNNVGSFTPTGNWCSCGFINNLVTINPSTTGYNVGGSNTIQFSSGNTCFGFINNASLGADYAQVAVTYPASGITFSWSPTTFLDDPTSQTPVASGITTTTTYTVTASNGTCSSSSSVTVTAGVELEVSVSQSNPDVCIGGDDTLTAVITGGAPDYLYSWAPGGETTPFIVVSPTATTTYTVTVLDDCGSSVDATATVNVSNPTPVVTPASGSYCTGSGGSVTFTASGGADSYTWEPATGLDVTSGPTVVASPATTTTYTVTGHGAGASISTITYTQSFTSGASSPTQCTEWDTWRAQLTPQEYTKLTLKGSNDPVGHIVTDPVVIAQIAAALNTNSGGTWTSGGHTWMTGFCGGGLELTTVGSICNCLTGYSIRPCIGNLNWGGINGPTCGAPSQVITVEFEIVAGCNATETVTVTVNEAPSVVATATPTSVCIGGSSQLEAITSSTEVYHIGTSNLVNVPNNCGNGSLYSDCGAGSPGFTWTDVGAGTASSISIQLQVGVDCNSSGVAHTLTLNGNNVGSFTPSGNYCNCAVPTSNYLYTIDPSTTGYNVGGTNTILFSSGGTCFGFANSAGTTLAPDYAIVTVNYGSTGNTFSWSPTTFLDDPNSQTPVASGITATTTYTVTASNGGCSGTSSVTVTAGETFVVEAPTATPPSSSSGEYCIPQSGFGCGFPDVITNVTYAGIANYTGLVCGQASGTPGYNPLYTSPNPTVIAGVANTLTVETGGDNEGMAAWIDYDQDGEFEPEELVLSGYLGTNPATYSTSVTIPTSALNGTTRLRVRCMFSGNPASIGPCATIFYTEAEDYLITIDSGTTVGGDPCPGGTWTLAVAATGGGEPYTYLWEGPGLVTDNTASVTAVINATSTYTVTVTDNCGESSTQTVTATVADVTTSVTPSSATQCDYESVELTASGTATSFTWAPADGLDVTSGATVNANPLVTTTYTVTGTLGACTIDATVTVTVNQSPIVNPTATPESVCENGTSQLDGTAHTLGYITYSDFFTAGVTATAAQCTKWNDFAASLAPQSYVRLTLRGSNDTVGVYTDDPTVVSEIAAAMYGGYDGTWTSNGRTWHVSHCAGLELGADESACICYNPGYEIRPCIGNGNWGGIGGGTCSVNFPGTTPSQTMVAEFQYSIPAPTTTYSWSPTTFLDDPTSPTPVASGITTTTTYTVTTNIAGCSSALSTDSVTVIAGEDLVVTATADPPPPSGYCTPAPTGANACIFMFITEVAIEGTTLDNPSGCAPTSYTLFPASGNTTADLTTGTTYTITLASIANPMNFSVWIDGDHDGVFSSGEMVVNNFMTQTAASTTFIVPSGALSGATRMRVRADYTASPPVNDPCNTLVYGETEDYIVSLSGGATIPACPGSPWELTATVSGGGEPYSYLWSGPDLVTNNTATVTAMPTATTTYTVSVTDFCGTTITQTVTTDVEDVSVSVTPTSVTQCDNESVDLTASGVGTSFTWAPAAGLNTTTGTTVTANPQVTTTYTVTAHSSVCTASATSTITVNAAPVLTPTATPANLCSGGTSQLDAGAVGTQVYHIPASAIINGFSNCGNGPYTCGGDVGFSWTDIGAGAVTAIDIQWGQGVECSGVGYSHTTTLNGVATPNFTTTVSNCGCAGVAPVLMGITAAPTGYNVGGTNTFMVTSLPTCYGFQNNSAGMGGALGADYATVTVTYGATGTTYSWSPTTFLDDPNSATPVASNVTSTTTYTVTGANGTCTSTASVTVAVEALATTPTSTTAPPSAYCSPTLFPTNGCNPINNITTSGGITNISNTNTHYNGTGFTYFSSQTVSQNAGSPFTLSVQSEGYCVSFSYYYVWIDWDQDGVFESSEELVHNVNCGNTLTDFTINVPATALDGTTRMRIMCDGSGFGDRTPCHDLTAYYSEVEDYNVTVVNGIIPGPPCAGTTVQLHANVTGGGSPYTYSWAPSGDMSDPTAENPLVTPSSTTTYTVTVTDICGGSATSTVTVEITPIPVVTVSPASSDICPGAPPVTLTASGATFYSWAPAAGLSTTTGSTVDANPSSTTTYTVTGTESGCASSATAVVTVHPVPVVTATATPSSICSGGTSQLEAIVPVSSAYCTPVYTLYDGSDYISNVTLNTINNSSGATPLPGYTDYTGSIGTSLVAGTSNTISITSGQYPSDSYSAWIDYDQDGVFVTGEQLGGPTNSPGAFVTFSYTFTVPAGALNGTTRLRVVCIDGGLTAIPCPTSNYGETEDYDITVTDGAPNNGVTYVWSPTTYLDDPTIANPVASGVQGQITYTVTVTNPGGCSASDTAHVTAADADLTFTGLDPDYCADAGAVVLTPTTPGGVFTGPGVILFGPDYYFDPSTSGVGGPFTITYTYGSCGSSSQNTTVHALPTVTLDPFPPICSDAPPLELTGGSPAGGFYFDSFGYVDGTYFYPSAAGPGVHTIYYAYTDQFNCSSLGQQDITVEPAATVDAGPDQTVCSISDVTLSGSFGGSATSVTWTTSGDGTFADESDPGTTYSPGLGDQISGSVTLTLTTDDPAGACAPASEDVVITFSLAVTYYPDLDDDGYGAGAPVVTCIQPAGTSTNNLDCNDGDASINPGMDEVCSNAVDDNCDGQVDENCVVYTYYADEDSDTYGDITKPLDTFSDVPPPGYVADSTDCNDADASIHPNQSDLCNGVDDDCDALTDEDATFSTWYADADDDGYGNPDVSQSTCDGAPVGYVADNQDCDDSNAAINPAATEQCNGLDDDCNGLADDGLVYTTYYPDADGDGYGSSSDPGTPFCADPGAAYSLSNTDCNDDNAAVNPGATDVCNGIDDNCDGQVDENPVVATITPSGTVTYCRLEPVTLTTNAGEGLSYQWYRNGVALAGETSSTFTTTKRGNFGVIVTNGFCTDTSEITTIARLPIPQANITVYGNTDICSAGSVMLRANKAQNNPHSYQWNKDGLPISGGTDRLYTATSTGDYTVTITNDNGCSVTSSSVTVTSSCKGLQQDLFSAELNLYPNPNHGNFVVELHLSGEVNSEADVMVMNTLGQTVYLNRTAVVNGELFNEVKFDYGVAAGNYLIKVIVGDKVYTGQIIYQK